MTALPVRWRNTNDALRKPLSVTAARGSAGPAPTAPEVVVAPCGPSGLPRPRPRLLARGSCRRAGKWRGDGRGSCGRCDSAVVGTAEPRRALRPAGRQRLPAGPSAGVCPLAACGTSGRWRSRPAARHGVDGRRAVRRRGTVRARGACGRHADGDLARLDNTGRGRWRRHRRSVLGQRGVQRRRRNTLGGFGRADHDPVTRRILHQVRGVARRDHAEIAGRLGKRGRGLRLEHVAFQRLLLLQQRLIGLAGITQLIGALGGVGRQPQRDAESEAQRLR